MTWAVGDTATDIAAPDPGTGIDTTTHTDTASSSLHEVGGNSAGTYTLDKTGGTSNITTIVDDPGSGISTQTGTAGSSSTAIESNTHSGYSATFTEILTDSGTVSGISYDDSGDYTLSQTGNRSDTFTDIGTDATGSYGITEGSHGGYTDVTIGDGATGISTLTETAPTTYSMTETVAGSTPFTLTESGTDGETSTLTANSVTGAFSQLETGIDAYTLGETGTGLTETVTGVDNYTSTDTGNNVLQTDSASTSGGGTWTRTSSGSGATLASGSGTNSYTQMTSGDALSGAFSESETGTDRYGLVDDFDDVSNAKSGAPGNITFHTHGLAFRDPSGGKLPAGEKAIYTGQSVEIQNGLWQEGMRVEKELVQQRGPSQPLDNQKPENWNWDKIREERKEINDLKAIAKTRKLNGVQQNRLNELEVREKSRQKDLLQDGKAADWAPPNAAMQNFDNQMKAAELGARESGQLRAGQQIGRQQDAAEGKPDVAKMTLEQKVRLAVKMMQQDELLGKELQKHWNDTTKFENMMVMGTFLALHFVPYIGTVVDVYLAAAGAVDNAKVAATFAAFLLQLTFAETHDEIRLAAGTLAEGLGGAINNAALMAAGAAFKKAFCFRGDTLVHTTRGLVRLDSVEVGMAVWSFDFAGGRWLEKKVTEVHCHEFIGTVITLEYCGGRIEATNQHPIYVRSGRELDQRPVPKHVPVIDHETLKSGRWINAEDIEVGDELLSLANNERTLQVSGVVKNHETLQVYNLSIEAFRNFAVAESGVLVHNVGGTSKAREAIEAKVKAAIAPKNAPKAFDVVPYGERASGFENHHGVLDVWAKENIPGYKSRASDNPSIRLTPEQHAKTKEVYREWLREKTGKPVGGQVDWTKVTKDEVKALTKKMLDAAGVPEAVQKAYLEEFIKYIGRAF